MLVPWTENHLSSFKCGFLNIFRAKTYCVVCHAYCFCYDGTNIARKSVRKLHFNVWNLHFIRLLRWFNLSQSGSRKNNRKAFEGASMEPTNQKTGVKHSRTGYKPHCLRQHPNKLLKQKDASIEIFFKLLHSLLTIWPAEFVNSFTMLQFSTVHWSNFSIQAPWKRTFGLPSYSKLH